jgi:hypothetical protein
MAKVNSGLSLLAAGAVAAGIKSLIEYRVTDQVKVLPLIETFGSYEQKVSIILTQTDHPQINEIIADILNQNGLTNFEILVDRQLPITDSRVRSIFDSAEATPAGWNEISWTCQKLAFAAEGEILVFINPRLVMATNLLISAINYLVENQISGLFINPKIKSPFGLDYLNEIGQNLPNLNKIESGSAISPDLLVIKKNAYNQIAGHTRVAVNPDLGVGLFRVLQNHSLPASVLSGGSLVSIGDYESKTELAPLSDIAVRFLIYLAPIFVFLFSKSKSLKLLSFIGMKVSGFIAFKQLSSFKPIDFQRLALTPLAALVSTIFDLQLWWKKWKA